MPRASRYILPNVPVHVIHRGVNRTNCFLSDSDFHDYWRLLRAASISSHCAVHAYVFMTNHVHMLVTPAASDSLSDLMKSLAQVYAQRFNRKYARTGPLWEGRHKVHLVLDERYLLTCYRYIELNPVRAGMCKTAGDYVWSSYRCNAKGLPDDVVSPHALYAAWESDTKLRRMRYIELFEEVIDDKALAAIRGR